MPISPRSRLTDPPVPEVLSSAFHMTETRVFLIIQGWSLAKMKTVWRPTSIYLDFTADINNVFTQLGFFCVTSWRGRANKSSWDSDSALRLEYSHALSWNLYVQICEQGEEAHTYSLRADSVAFPQLESAVSLNIFSASFLNPMYHTT